MRANNAETRKSLLMSLYRYPFLHLFTFIKRMEQRQQQQWQQRTNSLKPSFHFLSDKSNARSQKWEFLLLSASARLHI